MNKLNWKKIQLRRLILVALFFLFPILVSAAEQSARLDWSRRVELSVLVSGSVGEVLATVGTEVSKGQVLLRLDQRVYREKINEAKAKLESTKLENEEAQKELTRAQDLFDRTVLSIHELELAKIDAAKAEANFQAAKSALARAETELLYSEIRAPFDGRVIRVAAEVGQTINSEIGTPPLIVIADAHKMLAKTLVDEAQVNDSNLSKKVKIMVGSREFRGELLWFSDEPVANNDGKTYYEATIAFEARTIRLRAGQTVKVEMP